jgi:hypothetical protein
MQHPQHREPQEIQSPKNQKSPPIFTQICPKAPNPNRNKPKKQKSPNYIWKANPKYKSNPKYKRKATATAKKKKKTIVDGAWRCALARGATVAGAALNQSKKLSDVSEFAGKAAGGVRP